MTGNGSGIEEVSESSCLCASVLKKDAGVVEGGFSTETQRRRGTEFKMTEMGLILEDWEVKRLGEIGEPSMCKRVLKSQTSDSGDIPFYKIGTFGKTADAFISKELFTSFKRQYSYPKNGDVLISAAGTIGRTVVFDGNDAYFQDSNIVWIGHDERIVLNKYLKWCLEVIKWQTEDGGIVTRLYNDNIRNSLIPVPPLPEQKKIAEALSDVDELLAAMRTLIEKKRAIKQGAMQELLGIRNEELGMRNCGAGAKKVPRRRLPGFSGEWVEKRLGEIGEFIAGNGFPLNKQGGQSGKYPFFKVSDFNNVGNESALSIANNYISVSTFNELHCSLIPSGSIVFAKIGAAIALERKRRVCQDSCIDNNMMAFCVNKQNDERFVTECLRRIVFADLVESTALPALNVRKLREYKIIVPENISEQKAIAEVLSDMDAEIEALEAKRAKYESIKQGMMQELLTGKTRLV